MRQELSDKPIGASQPDVPPACTDPNVTWAMRSWILPPGNLNRKLPYLARCSQYILNIWRFPTMTAHTPNSYENGLSHLASLATSEC